MPPQIAPPPLTNILLKMLSRHKGDLKHHVMSKHPGWEAIAQTISRPRSDKTNKPFKCPQSDCSSGYLWMRDLKRHIKTKHPHLFGWASKYYLEDGVPTSTPTSTESIQSPPPIQPTEAYTQLDFDGNRPVMTYQVAGAQSLFAHFVLSKPRKQ